ncbi:MAG: NAD-dependent epimerase/dehydratase family protein [Bacteroidales bacterium]
MILLTGATGLVGSHLLYELVSGGRKVRATKRENSRLELIRDLFSWYDPHKGEALFGQVEWVDADLSDIVSLQEAVSDIRYIYHCAATVSFQPRDRQVMMKANVKGTANLVNVALQRGVEKFCHCSSVAALGTPLPGEVVQESLIWKTSHRHSYYAISKYGAEREVWRASQEGMDVVIINPTVVIGPGDPSRSSAQLYQSVNKGLKFYTPGVNGFVDARDVARAMVLLMEGNQVNERFIANSENLPFKTLFDYLALAAGVEPPKYRVGRWMSELAWRMETGRAFLTGSKPLLSKETARNAHNKRYFSNEKIKEALGIRFRPISEAAENTAGFFRKYPGYL